MVEIPKQKLGPTTTASRKSTPPARAGRPSASSTTPTTRRGASGSGPSSRAPLPRRSAITPSPTTRQASQLTDATVTDDGANVLKTWSWQYDPAGNRVRESVDTGSTYAQFNDLNQLTQLGGAGTTLIEGTTDEPASVSVNGGPALVTGLPGGDFLFRREIPVSEGGNTVTIEATDASDNTATQNYSIVVGGVQKVLEYDLNGNLRFEKDDQGIVLREFQWDARNRLVAIIDGTHTSEFTYDALDRRVRIVEKANGVEVANETYLWAGGEIVQKRDSTATTVLRNYFENGFTEGGSSYFYAKDHLGSIREVVAADGSTVEARYEYSPWGQVTKTGGTGVESDFAFTGHFHHAPTGLHLALYRAYDSESGRWLSRDPLGSVTSQMNAGMFGMASLDYYLMGITQPEMLPFGPNLYGYVGGNPVNYMDPEGEIAPWLAGAAAGAGISFGTQFWNNGGFSDLMSGRFEDAWNKAAKCTDWADVGLSAASGALFGGAFGNAVKAGQGLGTANAMRKINSVYTSPYMKPHIIDGVVKDAAKAAGKGIGASGVSFGKSQAGLPRDMCD